MQLCRAEDDVLSINAQQERGTSDGEGLPRVRAPPAEHDRQQGGQTAHVLPAQPLHSRMDRPGALPVRRFQQPGSIQQIQPARVVNPGDKVLKMAGGRQERRQGNGICLDWAS